MRIRLNNKFILELSLEEFILLEHKLEPYIVVENKAYIMKMNLGISVKDDIRQYSLADKEYFNNNKNIRLTMPIGLWDYTKHLFPEVKVIYEFENPQIDGIKEIQKYPQLYDYQKSAVINMINYRYGILKAKPGAGKTIMGIALSTLKGKSVLWINDRIDLCKQAMKTAIEKLHIPEEACGLLQGDNENVKTYTFTTIQKLHKVLNKGFNDITQKLRHFDVIIIDECHHCIGSFNDYKEYFQVLNEMDYKYLYGLTATPKRADGNEHLVYAILGPVRYEVAGTTKTMVAKVVGKHCKIETKEEVYETFVNKYTQKAMPAKVDEYLLFHEKYIEFVEDYVDEVIAKYNKVLIVSPRIAGAQFWSDNLTSKNIEHFLVYGAIKKREKLYTSKILVATIDLIKEGFDVPDLEAIIVTGRMPDKYQKTQIVGRSERFVEGKQNPIVYFLVPDMVRFEKPKISWEVLDNESIG